jgi:transcriptional regulator with XRE-family HTH domain
MLPRAEILSCGKETDRCMTHRSGAGPEGSGVEPALRGGGVRLPSLKQWRVRSGLTQIELAERAGLDRRYITKIETGKRGCNLSAAQRLADVLGVELAELRARPPGEQHPFDEHMRPAKPRVPFRNLQRAHLKVLLSRAVGSAYSVMSGEELERHCERLSWDEVLDAVSGRRREAEVLREMLADADLPEEVRLFVEEVLSTYPEQDICLLAAARSREHSEEGRERLTRAMRELL